MSIDQFLKFEPILKEKIWGGEKLQKVLQKETSKTNVGESWEISDVDNALSIVVNGALKGKSLKALIARYKGALVGDSIYQCYGENFPLLIKFIDAKEALSIQLHPNDELASKRHNSFGKTEMWYVMQADEKAHLIAGFKEEITQEAYVKNLENKTLIDVLQVDEVSEGDVYFIPTGTVHAIGAGVLLAEIQQTSDVTYRVYDWDRPNVDGTYRELHTEEALDAIDYGIQETYKVPYAKQKNDEAMLVTCPYFTTSLLSITKTVSRSHVAKDSFVIYMCVKGEVSFAYQNQRATLSYGETILVPACMQNIEIIPKTDSELLEVYIQ